MNATYKAYTKHLIPLVGGTVERVCVSQDDENSEPYCGLWIKMRSGKTFQVVALMDPEGNGPGHMEVLDVTASVG